MKKSIVYLGMAFLAFTNGALASNSNQSKANTTLSVSYSNATPLCMAICKGDVEIVKKFVEYGSDINETSNGMTPLMFAARYNNVEIIKYLISKGADVRTKDEKGFSALKYAEISNAKEAAAYLKELSKK